jgi:hypothetical protein
MRMTEQDQFPLTADSRWKKFWLALVIGVGSPIHYTCGWGCTHHNLGQELYDSGSILVNIISLEHTFASRKLCILYTQQSSSGGVLPTLLVIDQMKFLPFNVMEDFDMRLSHDRLTSFFVVLACSLGGSSESLTYQNWSFTTLPNRNRVPAM